MWKIVYTKQALKDKRLLEQTDLALKARALVAVLAQNPYQTPPPYEKLQGEKDAYSRRINRQHRLVYRIYQAEKTVMIARMWTHYEK